MLPEINARTCIDCGQPVKAAQRCKRCYQRNHYQINRDRRLVQNLAYAARTKDQKRAYDKQHRFKIQQALGREAYLQAKRSDALYSKYRMRHQDYLSMLNKQNGNCAICKIDHSQQVNHKHLSIDHDHTTGKVRGLLCNSCNRAIGYFKENVFALQGAIKYLESHKESV